MDVNSISKNCDLDNSNVPPFNEGTISPKIYVACQASYDCGYFRGNWIDVTQEVEVIYQTIEQVLLDSPISNAKDWLILQYEGFGSLQLGPYEDIEEIRKKAVLIAQFGDLGVELLSFYGGNTEEAKETLENRYQGMYEDVLEFAMQLFDDCYANCLPDSLKCYIDYGGFQRDIFIDDYFAIQIGYNVHIFSRY